jgi:flagellar basal-body rod modification protein FlgD
MTTPISPTSAPLPPSAAPAGQASRPDQLGKDAFMKLLVAQLRFQNPLSPSDPSQFMAQTAQFTMVEKLEELARNSTDLVRGDQIRTATALVGQQVSYTTDDGTDAAGVVGSVRFGANGPVLLIGDTEVAPGAVKEVLGAPRQ